MTLYNPLMFDDELESEVETSNTDPVEESAAISAQLEAQLRSSERLTEYYNQVVAELRASLEQIEREEQQAS
jgi:hypothetical protein